MARQCKPWTGTIKLPKKSTCREVMRDNCMQICGEEPEMRITADKVMRNLNRAQTLQVSGGPFHYQMRAGTYGEIYDEAGWKVGLGIGDIKERSGLDRSPGKLRYEQRVLVNNWVEERRDKNSIKYDNAPKLSEYGHIYKSEYTTSYSKLLCNKARDILLKIKTFPITIHPGHQPYLDVDVIRYSAAKPENCCLDEKAVCDRKACQTQKRYERQRKELGGLL